MAGQTGTTSSSLAFGGYTQLYTAKTMRIGMELLGKKLQI